MLDQVRFSNFEAVITRRPGQRDGDASLQALRSSLFGLHQSALLAEPESQTMVDQRSLLDEDEIDFDDADNLEPFPRFLVDPDWPAPAQRVNFRPGPLMQATAFVMSFACVAAGATLLRQSLMATKASVGTMGQVFFSAEWVRSLPVDETGGSNLAVKLQSGGAGELPLVRSDNSEAASLAAPNPAQMKLPAMAPRRHTGLNGLQ